MIEAMISEALYARLLDHEFSQLLKISFPGVQFTVPVEPWISAKNYFSRTDQVTMGDAGYNRYVGFLRADINYPAGLDGELPALRLAGELVSLFKRGTEMPLSTGGWVRVIWPPNVTDPLETSEWLRVPVTIRWQSDNPNVS